jgi:Tfp pilus assembly protein PilO
MPPFEFDLNKLKNIKLTKEQQQYLFLGVVFFFGGIYVYWKYLMMPLNTQVVDLRVQVEEKERSLKEVMDMQKSWEEYDDRLAAVQRGTQFAARRIPASTALAGVLLRMNRLFLEGGMEMTKFRPDTSSSIKSEFPGISKFIADVSIMATYNKFGVFLSRLSAEDIVYNVEDVQVRAGGAQDDPGAISVGMRVVVYYTAGGEGK